VSYQTTQKVSNYKIGFNFSYHCGIREERFSEGTGIEPLGGLSTPLGASVFSGVLLIYILPLFLIPGVSIRRIIS